MLMRKDDVLLKKKNGNSGLREMVGVRGEARIVIIDKNTYKKLLDKTIKNVITDNGINLFTSRIASPWSAANWCLELGTGTGTPSNSDTDLFAPISDSRKKGTKTKVAYNQIQYYVRYMPEELVGYTFTECGIWENTASDLSGGVLVNHLLIEPAIEKTADILVDFYINFYLS